MATPNVLARTHYYGIGHAKRDFYSSNKSDDYIGYIDKGIKSNAEIDYMDYSGNEEKSSGLFSSNGLLTDEEKKTMREKLRTTKSVIWDTVISFEAEYGKKNVYDYRQAVEMLNKTLPKYLESLGIDYDNVTWFAGLHTNTDNRHIHLSFFENEPRIYDKKTKSYRYRKGKVSIPKVNDFKMSIEEHFLSPIEGIKRIRKMAVDEARRKATGLPLEDESTIKRLLKELYEEIPKTGDLGYASPNMDGCREKLDDLSDLILENKCLGPSYRFIVKKLDERDIEIGKICQKQGIQNPEPYLYDFKFKKDLKRRMGNATIKALVEERKKEQLKASQLKHPKAIIGLHTKSVLGLLAKAASLSEQVSYEALDAFEEFERSLKEAEYKRLVEEGIIDPEGNEVEMD